MAETSEAICRITIARGIVQRHCYNFLCEGYYDGSTPQRGIRPHEAPPFPKQFSMDAETWIKYLEKEVEAQRSRGMLH